MNHDFHFWVCSSCHARVRPRSLKKTEHVYIDTSISTDGHTFQTESGMESGAHTRPGGFPELLEKVYTP